MCVYQNVNGTPCEQQIDQDFQLQRETFCTRRLLCTKRYRTIKRSHNAALLSFFLSSNTARRGKQSKAVGWQSVKNNNRSNKQAVVLHRSYSVQVTNIQIQSSATIIIFKAKLHSTVGLASLRYISTLLHICRW